jgi:predicted lipoprotein DUF2279
LFCLISIIVPAYSQADTTSSSSLNTKRLIIVAGANAAFYTVSFIALNKAWYADYEKTKFHFFNDMPEWNQMDKAGHVWSTYQLSRLSKEMWEWTGLNRNTSAILGGVSGMVYQSIIEIQDAYSAQWGFSWGDIGANIAGAGIYVLQEVLWRDQKLSIKLGYWPKNYPDELVGRSKQLFGDSEIERMLKDYNSQTYWLSVNIASMFPQAKMPAWLNVAFGYGADGMYGGRTNTWKDNEGVVHEYDHIPRIREFYFSPDIDLTKIRTRSKVLRSVFFVLNMVKIPTPALAIESGGGVSLKIR